jgi:Fe-S-cluster containining protein
MELSAKKILWDSISSWRESIGNSPGPMRLSGLALHAMALSEILLVADESATEAAGSPVTCRKGCGACCRHVVPVSPPEAFLLAEVLEESRPENPEWEIGFDENMERLKREGLENASLINHADVYFSLRMPCPFLSEESCSIRARRPLACREHLVISSPAHCVSYPDPYIRPMDLSVSIREALSVVAAEAMSSAPEMIPLIRVRDWVAANGDAGEREWDAGILLDKLVRILRERS